VQLAEPLDQGRQRRRGGNDFLVRSASRRQAAMPW
jgi:hypothetical protein